MPPRPSRRPHRAALSFVAGVTLLVGACNRGDGLSDYERAQQKQAKAADSLKAQKAKVEKRHYPQGEAHAVDLTGATVSPGLIADLATLNPLSELNLSKSTVTDADLVALGEKQLVNYLVKFDLSHTAVTDDGLDRLTNLMLLKNLNLKGSKVTPAGVERFKTKRKADSRIQPFFKSPAIEI